MTGLRSIAVIAFVLAPSPAWAEEAETSSSAAALVEQAFARDVVGEQAARDELLKRARENDPDFAPAHWQSGQVRSGDQWLSLQEVGEAARASDLRDEYEQLRAESKRNAADQFRLAQWCKRVGLEEEYQGQLMATLYFEPNHLNARAALGYTLVAGSWMTREELAEARASAKSQMEAFDRWKLVVNDIKKKMSSKSETVQREGYDELCRIDDSSSIMTMEALLSGEAEVYAKGVVRALANMSQPEATVSLARHAVVSNWPDVRAEATKQLVDRPQQDYVPQLVSSMYQLWESETSVDYPCGRVITQSYFREGFDKRQQFNVISEIFYAHRVSNSQLAGGQAAVNRDSVLQARRIAADNEVTAETNDRIAYVLTEVTGEKLGTDPEPWWDYWNAQTDSPPQFKPLQTGASYTSAGQSCFAAGTPVWTNHGPKAIETIRVGDRVACQDIETGELAFHSVGLTTQRKPVELMRLTLGNEKITCTKGHSFWVVGRGWVQARHLQAGDRLNGMTGRPEFVSMAPAGVAPTFNLVIDGPHDYLVGNQQILVHDNSPVMRARRPLPGMKPVD